MATKTETTEKTKKDKKKSDKPRETASESLAGIAAVLVSGLYIITFIVQAFEIPSRSMVNTLQVGDHVFVDRLTPVNSSKILGPLMPYREIHRGDIIVFISPVQPGLHVVKRVIGIPGDKIHLRDGVVSRNGVALNEPYVVHSGSSNRYADNFPSVPPEFGSQVAPEWPAVVSAHKQGEDLVIPPDNYFGMGDNRDDSLDSRYWGFIPRENIIGRPLFIYWSFDTPEDQYQHTSMGERIGFVFHVVIHFFDKTQWRRMFHMVR
ncbi:MAG TPA: signal peptidase I [Candidatus Angelobacter sp.]|nr:signal peptidase I [Candidatus Angelobacter sp.]